MITPNNLSSTTQENDAEGNPTVNESGNLFTPESLIHSYTRAQAIHDGVLIDLTEWASATKGFKGGFTISVAVTASVWSDINAIPPRAQDSQDVRGRAHDVLFMASLAARRNVIGSSPLFIVLIDVGRTRRQQYRITIGPGDFGEPVVTIMKPNED